MPGRTRGVKDLGAAKQILGMRITRDQVNGILKLSQEEYVKKVLSRFNMDEAKPVIRLWLVTSNYPKSNHPQQSKNEPTWPKCLILLLLEALRMTWCIQDWI